MKSTVQRALWAFTLKATVLRHPLPPAPMAAPESEPEAAPVQVRLPTPSSDWSNARVIGMDGAGSDDMTALARFKVTVNGEPRAVLRGWGPDPAAVVLGTIPAGTLKAGEPLSMKELAEAYVAATTGAPGKAGLMKEFQRLHLGEPYPYKVNIDPGGDDMTAVTRWERGGFHGGGWRLVGERTPELVVMCPRRTGKASLRRRAVQQPLLESDEFLRQVCAAVFGVPDPKLGSPADTEGGSCD